MNYLEKLRKDKGLLQVDVAKDLRIAQSTVSKLEANKLDPNMKTLKLYSLRFKVTTDKIIDKLMVS